MTNQEANQYISKHLNDIGSALHSYGHFKYNIQDLNTDLAIYSEKNEESKSTADKVTELITKLDEQLHSLSTFVSKDVYDQA